MGFKRVFFTSYAVMCTFTLVSRNSDTYSSATIDTRRIIVAAAATRELHVNSLQKLNWNHFVAHLKHINQARGWLLNVGAKYETATEDTTPVSCSSWCPMSIQKHAKCLSAFICGYSFMAKACACYTCYTFVLHLTNDVNVFIFQ